MKLIVDAQLPNKLCEILNQLGINSIHVDELPEGDETSDSDIIQYADKNDLIVLTKDYDFYHSHMADSSMVRVLTNLDLSGFENGSWGHEPWR